MSKRFYSKRINYESGQRYSNFVLIKIAFNKLAADGSDIPYWECKCDCGKIFHAATKHMRTRIKSCGCLSKSNRFKKRNSDDVITIHKINHYKNSAKNRNIYWELTEEQFKKLLFDNCFYCQSPPLTLAKTKNHKMFVNGIDRKNNDIGYVIDNCVSCCKFCNRAKSDSSLEEFLNWINRFRGNFENCSNI